VTDRASDGRPRLRAALFDLGDTLVQCTDDLPRLQARALSFCHEVLLRERPGMSKEALFRAAQEALTQRAEELAAANLAFPAHERVAIVLQRLGIGRRGALVDELVARLYQPISECSRALPEARDALGQLKSARLRLGLMSNTPWDVPGELVDRDLERLGLREYFDALVYSDCGYRKPHPGIFRRALQALDVEASETIMVGDSLADDIAGAAAMGIRTLWVAAGSQKVAPRKRGAAPDFTAPDLRAAAEVILKLIEK
jgi:putative hydrolase of the HAD superfamily